MTRLRNILLRTALFTVPVCDCAHAAYPRPEDCSPVHGVAQVETPAQRPIWRRGRHASSDTGSIAHFTIYVFDAKSRGPLSEAFVDFELGTHRRRAPMTDTLGLAAIELPVGAYAVRARRIRMTTYADTVFVHPGQADTLRLGMGRLGYCAM